MSARRDQLHTAIAVATSALLHACVIGVAGMSSSAILAPDEPELIALAAALPLPPIVEPPPPASSDSVPVGNPDSTITAETWLGYNELEEHVATTRGPIDQPALSFDPPTSQPDAPPAPISSPPAPPPAAAQPANPAVPIEPPQQPVTNPPDEPSPAEPQTTPPQEPNTLDPPKAPEPSPPIEEEPADNPPPGDEPAPPTDTTPPPPSEPAELDGPPTDPVEPPAPIEPPATAELQPQPPPMQPSVAVAPSPPAPPPSPSATDDARGVQSDRESDAAAIKTAARAHLGKPLATKGLRIRTVRPRTSHYNAILARYIDPVVRVHFDKRGVVAKVEFIRRSENRDVDLYVLNAVYQWTAEGPQLEALPNSDPPATLSVDFVIVRPLSG